MRVRVMDEASSYKETYIANLSRHIKEIQADARILQDSLKQFKKGVSSADEVLQNAKALWSDAGDMVSTAADLKAITKGEDD